MLMEIMALLTHSAFFKAQGCAHGLSILQGQLSWAIAWVRAGRQMGAWPFLAVQVLLSLLFLKHVAAFAVGSLRVAALGVVMVLRLCSQ